MHYFFQNIKINMNMHNSIIFFINYIGLFSEIYLFISFFLLLGICIILNLSKNMNFPNIYKFTSFFFFIFCFNVFFIDLFNNIEIYNTFDFYKNFSDIIIKYIVFFFTLLLVIYSKAYMCKIKLHMFEFILVIFVILLSFSLFIITTDLLNFYLLLEIQSLCFYLLTSFNKHNQYSVESGLKYFILSSFSSVCLLFGFSFIYGLTGSLNLLDITLFFSVLLDDNFVGWLSGFSISGILILVAFLFKLYISPFHLWVGDIYQGSPSITTAFFGTITILPLFYVFIKYFVNILFWVQPYFSIILLVLSILSMIMGLFSAIYAKKIKRLIAFSSVSNIGYLLIGFIQENVITFSNSLAYLLLYIVNITGIFIIFLNLWIAKYKVHLERLSLLSGFFYKNKWLAIIIIIFFFTAAGIPPFSLFIGKIMIIVGVTSSLYTIILFILVFTAIVSSFYYLKVIKYISFNIFKEWLHVSLITYTNALFLVYFAFFSIFFIFGVSTVYILSNYIILIIS